MAKFSFTVYKNSVVASIISFLGTMYIYVGVLVFVVGLFDGMELSEGFSVLIILGGFGGGHLFLAKYISERKQFRKFVKHLKENHIEQEIPNSVELALKVYQMYPEKATRKYIAKLNPEAGEEILKSINNKK